MGGDLALWQALLDGGFTYWGLLAALAKLSVYLPSFLAAGLLLFLIALPISDIGLRSSLLKWAAGAAVLAAMASALRVMVQAGRVMDDRAFMTDPEIVSIVLEGPLGTSTLVRLIGLGTIILAVLLPSVRLLAGMVGALLVAGSFALTGHATRDPQWALSALVTVHLLAVSFWFGALLPLYKLAAPDSSNIDEAAHMAHRFGQQATVVVSVLVIVGGIFGYLLLGSPAALFGSAYGQMLLLKLAFVTAVLGIAALNKLRLVPALASGDAKSAERFRASLRWEGLVFVAIFAATAFLTTSFTLANP